jgi:phospholipid/cholesterol/gamma-HCH transport system substrate-binding protein
VHVNRTAAVGAFVIGGMLLFAVGLFLIGDRRMLFTDTFEVYAEFTKVSGLQNGAKVRVAGLDAGEVLEIHVPTGPSAKFRVKMRVREDLHPLIRVDSVAAIQNDGLVGNKFMQIEAGTDRSPAVAAKGTIQSREPFDLADLLQKMSVTIDTINTTLVDVKAEVDDALSTISDTVTDAQALMKDVGGDVRKIIALSNAVTDDVGQIVAGLRQGRGTVGKLLTDDSLFASAKSIAAQAEQAVANLKEASEQAKGALADLRGGGGPFKGLTGDLQLTLTHARDAMADLADNTEALKRNFLFRGFFNRRGYFDLHDVSVQQYRQGALATKDRRVLRIWLLSGVLFEKDANGRERLSDGGRARLDSAMAQFVRYPKTSPFVIEGYSQEETEGQRYLIGRTRAEVVRDYLVSTFHLDPRYIATMPMGAEADGSPTGDRWDGVALSMFVSTSAL